MRDALLRKARGSPYAAAKTRAASQPAGSGYPRREIRDDPQGFEKITGLGEHHKIKNVAAAIASEAKPDLPLRVNEERRMTFAVQRAKANELASGPAQARVLAGNRYQVGAGLHFAGGE